MTLAKQIISGAISHTVAPDQKLSFNQWAKHIRKQLNKIVKK